MYVYYAMNITSYCDLVIQYMYSTRYHSNQNIHKNMYMSKVQWRRNTRKHHLKAHRHRANMFRSWIHPQPN